jgi:phosphate acetyltransferase
MRMLLLKKQIIKKKNKGKIGEVIDLIIENIKNEEQFDFVLVEGTSFSGEGTVIELDMNVLILKNLGIPTIVSVQVWTKHWKNS